MNIIRVFPRRTSYTPGDGMAFVGDPPGLLIPPHDEVHISCAFTWDKAECERLRYQWQMYTDKPVKLGGPAYASPCGTFEPGMYVKRGVTFTSYGCNNKCAFCLVPGREGALRELPVTEGNIIQDNNFLQCSRSHKDAVFAMLKSQAQICFKGGLQNDLIDDHFVENVRGLRIKELWLACDDDAAVDGMARAVEKLKKAGFAREHIRCYVLIGTRLHRHKTIDDIDIGETTMQENERRLQAVYAAGAMPFAQILQPAECFCEYPPEWKKFARQWMRPPSIIAHCERGTDMNDYST